MEIRVVHAKDNPSISLRNGSLFLTELHTFAEVFDFFQKGGKGHLTRMQNVLRAYVKAQTKKAG